MLIVWWFVILGKKCKIIKVLDVSVSNSRPRVFICFCTAASALRQVTKEQVGVFFPHIFNQSVSVCICICIEQRDAECQRWDFEKHSIFPFSDGNKGGWMQGWIKAGRWLNSETWCSSSSLPWALVFLLSSCGLYLHPRVQQRQRSPGRELVSGLGRMEKFPKGEKHLWSYRHTG